MQKDMHASLQSQRVTAVARPPPQMTNAIWRGVATRLSVHIF
jgi:hypothetical protein